jgi:hypothetical protein
LTPGARIGSFPCVIGEKPCAHDKLTGKLPVAGELSAVCCWSASSGAAPDPKMRP